MNIFGATYIQNVGLENLNKIKPKNN